MAHHQKLLLELQLVILEGVLHEDSNGFLLTGCMHIQQLLGRVCGEPHSLGHLLAVVLSCLLKSCGVLTLGQGCHCILQTRDSPIADGIQVGLH